MTTTASTAPPPDIESSVSSKRKWSPGLADLVFLLTALAVIWGAAHGLLDDPGLGWHLRNIDAMREAGGWLTLDPFTDHHGRLPTEWYTNQWLGELPLWIGWKLAGLEGIAVAAAMVIALLARCLYVMLLHDGLPWSLALVWTLLGTLGTQCSWTIRPNIFTILFVLITGRVAERYAAGALPRSRTWWLVPVFILWANIHGGFVAGLIVLVVATSCEVACAVGSLTPQARSEARSRAVNLTVLTGACILGTLVNPYGIGLYRWVFLLLGETYFMNLHKEWLSPDFRSAGAMRFEILILLFPFILGLSARRPRLLELGLAVLWLHLALTGFRYVALWVVLAVPVMARSSIEIPYLQELVRRWRLDDSKGLFARPLPAGAWPWSAVIACVLLVGAAAANGQLAHHGDKILATKALDQFLDLHAEWRKNHGRRPVILHSYDWGGYLTWHGWPDVLNWIDDRNEAQGKEHVQEHFALRDAEPGWEKKIEMFDLICIESGAALTGRLEKLSERWQESYRDETAVIFERRSR
jgi:hypothetical protein